MRHLSSRILLSALLVLGFAAAPHAFAAEKPALPEAARIHFSHNWAGYVAREDAYSGVRGSWTVPASSPSEDRLSASAVWIGIGGSGSHDLIQVGTQALARNGTTTYQVWYETLPDVQRALPIEVSPGDAVSASLQEELSGLWHLVFRNETAGTQYETYLFYISNHDSAEWIVERPYAVTEKDEGYLPLNDFDTVSFTDAAVVTTGGDAIPFSSLLSAHATEPVMMDRSRSSIQATPSAVDEDGFTVTYLDTSEGEGLLRALKRRYREVETEPAPKRELPAQTITPASGTIIIRIVF